MRVGVSRVVVLAALCLCLGAARVSATAYTWTNAHGNDGQWSTASNWSPAGVPGLNASAADSVTIVSPGYPGISVTCGITVTIEELTITGDDMGMTFNEPLSCVTLSFSSGGGTLTFNHALPALTNLLLPVPGINEQQNVFFNYPANTTVSPAMSLAVLFSNGGTTTLTSTATGANAAASLPITLTVADLQFGNRSPGLTLSAGWAITVTQNCSSVFNSRMSLLFAGGSFTVPQGVTCVLGSVSAYAPSNMTIAGTVVIIEDGLSLYSSADPFAYTGSSYLFLAPTAVLNFTSPALGTSEPLSASTMILSAGSQVNIGAGLTLQISVTGFSTFGTTVIAGSIWGDVGTTATFNGVIGDGYYTIVTASASITVPIISLLSFGVFLPDGPMTFTQSVLMNIGTFQFPAALHFRSLTTSGSTAVFSNTTATAAVTVGTLSIATNYISITGAPFTVTSGCTMAGGTIQLGIGALFLIPSNVTAHLYGHIQSYPSGFGTVFQNNGSVIVAGNNALTVVNTLSTFLNFGFIGLGGGSSLSVAACAPQVGGVINGTGTYSDTGLCPGQVPSSSSSSSSTGSSSNSSSSSTGGGGGAVSSTGGSPAVVSSSGSSQSEGGGGGGSSLSAGAIGGIAAGGVVVVAVGGVAVWFCLSRASKAPTSGATELSGGTV